MTLRALAAALVTLVAVRAAAAGPTISLEVDLREAPRRIFHVRETLRVPPGPLTLAYPKWIPGTHGPTGPEVNVAGLRITAGGHALPWRRDPVELHHVHCEVPRGARAVEVAFDYLSPAVLEGFAESASTSAHVAVLEWNVVVLYPWGGAVRDPLHDVRVAASLRLPPGWKHATALPLARRVAGVLEFRPVSLEALVDSPVLAGAHLRTIPLDARHAVHLAAEAPPALDARPSLVSGWRRLVGEAGALFGARHYRRYDFLVALADPLAHFGLEHHESSDNRLPERGLTDDDLLFDWTTVLPHEFVHSWNGKHRRPAGLVTRDFTQPERTELLWVYEGLTNYLGWVLAARSGLRDPEGAREQLAANVAFLAQRPGRRWRPLADTARAAPLLYGAPTEWASWRRGVDFYREGTTLWLEVDTIIRRTTRGARSLDDFCRRFFGAAPGDRGAGGAPTVRPYVLEDVVRTLGEVAPHDWGGFFARRVAAVSLRAPFDAIAAAGWKLTFTDAPNRAVTATEKSEKLVLAAFYSLGLYLRDDATIADVVPGMPAARAGVAPGMKLLGVGGRRFSPTVLRETLRSSGTGRQPLELLVENGDFYRRFELLYRGGDRQPHLVRIPGAPDLLGEIFKPRAR